MVKSLQVNAVCWATYSSVPPRGRSRCDCARSCGLRAVPAMRRRLDVVSICGTLRITDASQHRPFLQAHHGGRLVWQHRSLRSKLRVALAQQQVPRRWMARCRKLLTWLCADGVKDAQSRSWLEAGRVMAQRCSAPTLPLVAARGAPSHD
jgi:hypothetical protein